MASMSMSEPTPRPTRDVTKGSDVELSTFASTELDENEAVGELPEVTPKRTKKKKDVRMAPRGASSFTMGDTQTFRDRVISDGDAEKLPRWRSWTPGDSVDYAVPLRPPREDDRVGDTSHQLAEDQGRVFGGIEQHWMRTKLPPESHVDELRDFYELLQEEKQKKHRVVAFVNSRSGGSLGELLMKVLSQSIGEEKGKALFGNVCDLSAPGEPEKTIASLGDDVQQRRKTIFGHIMDTRVLVCGGDGTVTWILTAFEQCKALRNQLDRFPVAIVPLGTGNDLARSLGWGPRLSNVGDILKYLRWLGQADVVTLDQWRIVLRPHAKLASDHKLRKPGSHPQRVRDEALRKQLLRDLDEVIDVRRPASAEDEVYLGYWQNYYSFGADARIALAVDLARQTGWGRCFFRWGLGKLVYGIMGIPNTCCQTGFDGNLSCMKVAVESDKMKELSPPLHKQAVSAGAAMVSFVNINSYGAGMKVLPEPPHVETQPEPGDGWMDVFTVRNMPQLLAAGFLRCGRPNHLASGEAFSFTLNEGIDMQLDGEAWRLQSGCDVILEPHRKVCMLRAPIDSGNWRGHIKQDFWRIVNRGFANVSKRWSNNDAVVQGLEQQARPFFAQS